MGTMRTSIPYPQKQTIPVRALLTKATCCCRATEAHQPSGLAAGHLRFTLTSAPARQRAHPGIDVAPYHCPHRHQGHVDLEEDDDQEGDHPNRDAEQIDERLRNERE